MTYFQEFLVVGEGDGMVHTSLLRAMRENSYTEVTNFKTTYTVNISNPVVYGKCEPLRFTKVFPRCRNFFEIHAVFSHPSL